MQIWNTALVDWEERILARKSLIPDFPLNKAVADKAERIFRRLKVSDMPGKPAMGDVCGQWVIDFVRVIFGCYDPVARQRAIQDFFLLVAKKNTKSTLAAGIMMTALIMNERDFGEYMIIAPTKEIADNSFIPAYGMVVNDPALLDLFKPNKITREITNRISEAKLMVVSADANVVGGKKAIAVLIDELWLFGKKHDANNMLSEATGSMASRPEGFVIYLSTQSDDPPAGVFKEKLDYHRAVRDGKIKDPRSFQVIYEYPKAMLENEAWKDPANFWIPNPNYGRSVSQTFLESEYIKKSETGVSSLRLFAAKHLNVEIGVGLRTDAWAGVPFWEAQSVGGPRSLKELCDRSDVVTIGIDGGGLDDLFGFTAIGREHDTKRWLTWSRAWAHLSVLQRHKQIEPRLRDFHKADELVIVDNQLRDLEEIIRLVKFVLDAGKLGGVGVDPAGIGQLVDALADIDLTVDNGGVIGIQQGFALMNAIKTCERRLASGTLLHAGQGMMSWCVSNLKIEPTATAIRATRLGVGSNKIDPAIALFDAAVLMSTNPEPLDVGSVYEDRGLLWA